jgi:hypothetical protein
MQKDNTAMKKLTIGVLAFVAMTSVAHAQGSNNGNGNSGNGNGNGNGNVANNSLRNSYRDRLQAPGIGAPGLAAAGAEVCLGSASGGVSGPGFGLTFGATYPEKDCNLRSYARSLQFLGHKAAATQMLCYNADVADALAATGYPCRVGPRRQEVVIRGGYKTVAVGKARSSKSCKRYDLFRGCLD